MTLVKAKEKVTLTVNGSRHELEVDPSRSLLSVLRNELDLTGAKRSCDDGDCGSCMVLLGSKGVMSCLLPVSRAQTKEVTTVEGLATLYSGEKVSLDSGTLSSLHPLQQAFEEFGATQCGFCIPGMLMQSKALLDVRPNPTREEITKWLARNLCRCTGYVKIIEAVEYAVDLMKGVEKPSRWASVNGQNGPIVGASVARRDTLAKAIGEAKYAADLKMPGMLHAKILRSPHHHARILSIDISDAEAVPGVEAVVTYDHIPAKKEMNAARPQVYLFAKDTVRFKGEAIAAVAAASLEAAEEAVECIKVEYEPLPAVFDQLEAMKDEAPKLYPPYKNYVKAADLAKGDVAKGFAEADVVVEATYATPPWEHAQMEQEAALAHIDEEGRVVLYTPLHHTFPGRDWVADCLGIEREQVRLICPTMGGNFGARGDFVHAGTASLLAFKTRRPVKLEYSREESILGSAKSHNYYMKHKTGATKDGRIVAVDIELIANGGCWVPIPELTKQKSQIGGLGVFATGPYDIPNVSVQSYEVCTNRSRSSPLRGTSMPQMALAWESQMDLLAEKLGMDPLEFRIKNAVRPGSVLSSKKSLLSGQYPPRALSEEEVLDDSVGAVATLEALRPYYEEAKRRAAESPPQYPWKRGIGLACSWKGTGGERDDEESDTPNDPTVLPHHRQGQQMAAVELLEDGRVRVLSGAVEQGMGITTILIQIVAEAVGMSMDQMDIIIGDSLLAPYYSTTNAQKTTFRVGGALVDASRRLKHAITKAASEILEEPQENMEIHEGYAYSTSLPEERVSTRQIAEHFRERGFPMRYEGVMVFAKVEEAQGPVLSYGSQLTELDVNVESGETRVNEVVFAADVGKVLNPRSFEGQIEGGVIHALGFALREKYVPGETTTLKSLKIPGTRDVPVKVVSIDASVPVTGGPFSAKGMGTLVVCPGVPATLNAMASATGARIYSLPASPDRVMEAIEGDDKKGVV